MLLERTRGEKLTTMKIGGGCDVWRPPGLSDLIAFLERPYRPYVMLGNGSNSVFKDEVSSLVIQTKNLTAVTALGNGRFSLEAGVPMIPFIMRHGPSGHGGIEFLVSVPATLGGAIFMNAGEGRRGNNHIGRFVESVTAWHNGGIVTLTNKQCLFGYRTSVFQRPGYVILSAILKLELKSLEQIRTDVIARRTRAREYYDNSASNAGTTYVINPSPALRPAGRVVDWSPKRANWLLNHGSGTFRDVELALPTMDGLEMRILS